MDNLDAGTLLVTGATGFIGSRLALAAKAKGMSVQATGMARDALEQSNLAELQAAGIPVTVDRITDIELGGLLQGVDAIVHLAAAQHEVSIPDAHFRAVNVHATKTLIDAAVQAGVRRFIYASTIGVWGERSGTLDESVPPSPDNIYGETKLAAERAVGEFSPRIETVIIRVPETYGPADGRLIKLFHMASSKRTIIVGRGRNLHQPMFVNDLADLFLCAVNHPNAAGRTFVAAGPEALTSRQMLEGAAGAIGRELNTLALPMPAMLAVAHAVEWLFGLIGKAPPLHRRRLGFFTKSQQFNTDYLDKELGFRPKTSFRDGIARTARWYIDHGRLPAPTVARDDHLTRNDDPGHRDEDQFQDHARQ